MRRSVERRSPRSGPTSKDALPEPRLQLATYSVVPPAGEGWLHEIKFDGYRIAATLVDGTARLTTRNLLDWTHRFPSVAAEVARLRAASAIIDGEIVALTQDDRSDFAALQHWLAQRKAAANEGRHAALGRDGTTGSRIAFQAFDLLYLDGRDLRDVPLVDRKDELQRLLEASTVAGTSGTRVLRYTDDLRAPGPVVLRSACSLGLEGIVSKRGDAPYRAGRSEDWLKSTCLTSDEFVIGGFTYPRGSRSGFGALLLGEPGSDGSLRYVGKVGTGFDDTTLSSVRERLEASERSSSPFSTDVPRAAISTGVTWVEPRHLAEVVYVDRTSAGMLRQARFHSLREDKTVDDPTIDGDTQRSRANMQVSGVTLTNPDRVLYPDQGITKLRLAEYYADVGTEMLRWTKGRPLSLVRCPEGSEEQCFYQKHPGAGFAARLPRVPIEESDGVAEYVYLDTERDLIALVQSGVLEVHAWNSTVADLEHPDMLVLDLDPSEGVEFEFTKATARALRDLLGRLDLGAYVRTTGGKGLHVVVPLVPKSDWDGIKAFARGLSETMAATDPDRLTTNMSKQKRVGKVFIDYLRNSRGATAIANYSSRSRRGAPVAVPLRWDELARLTRADAYDVDSVRRRLGSLKSHPWEGFEEARRPLPTLEAAS